MGNETGTRVPVPTTTYKFNSPWQRTIKHNDEYFEL